MRKGGLHIQGGDETQTLRDRNAAVKTPQYVRQTM